MKNKLMSIFVLLFLFTFTLTGCNNSSNSPISSAINNETDIPCIPESKVYIGNSDNIGLGGTVYYIVSYNELYIRFNSHAIDGKNIHVQLDTTSIHTTGNMPPGQMTYSINNVVADSQYVITLPFTVKCNYWLYIHIDMGTETAWVGNNKRGTNIPNKKQAGQGGWRWWSTNPCSCN